MFRYVDDFVIVGPKEAVDNACKAVEVAVDRSGLRLNSQKTELHRVSDYLQLTGQRLIQQILNGDSYGCFHRLKHGFRSASPKFAKRAAKLLLHAVGRSPGVPFDTQDLLVEVAADPGFIDTLGPAQWRLISAGRLPERILSALLNATKRLAERAEYSPLSLLYALRTMHPVNATVSEPWEAACLDNASVTSPWAGWKQLEPIRLAA